MYFSAVLSSVCSFLHSAFFRVSLLAALCEAIQNIFKVILPKSLLILYFLSCLLCCFFLVVSALLSLSLSTLSRLSVWLWIEVSNYIEGIRTFYCVVRTIIPLCLHLGELVGDKVWFLLLLFYFAVHSRSKFPFARLPSLTLGTGSCYCCVVF